MRSEKRKEYNMTLTERKQDLHVVVFDSITDQLETTLKEKSRWTKDNTGLSLLDDTLERDHFPEDGFKGRRFSGGWKGLEKALFEPWDEGMKTYDRIMNQLRDEELPRPKSLKRVGTWSDEEGDDVDMDRLRAGQTYLRTTRRSHRPGPLSVTVVAVVGDSAGWRSMDLLYRGAAAIALTEILEKVGYRVELWATRHVGCPYSSRWVGGASLLMTTLLKRGSDPLDTIAFINAVSGWCFRTLYFGSMWLCGTPMSRYGFPKSLREEHTKHFTSDQQVIICDNIGNHSQAVSTIRSEIAKLK